MHGIDLPLGKPVASQTRNPEIFAAMPAALCAALLERFDGNRADPADQRIDVSFAVGMDAVA